MNYENINYNEIIISGKINNITDTNDKYIKFGITANKYTTGDNKNVYVSLNIERKLYNIYKDYFVKDKKVYVKGYLNSYIDKNRDIKTFVTVSDMSINPNELINDRKHTHIRYDPDGVMVWNGERCESEELSDEEEKQFKDLLNEITNERTEDEYVR